MYRLEKRELDTTPHQNEEYNHIKKQYVKHITKICKTIRSLKAPYWSSGGIVSDKMCKVFNFAINDKDYFLRPPVMVNTIFIFDYIETDPNPGYYLEYLKSICNEDTRIFITCPCRTIMSFWSYNHWHEIDPYRFKHLVEGCGFKIVQHKDKIIWKKWYQYIGFRGILRLLFGHYHLHIYELRLK